MKKRRAGFILGAALFGSVVWTGCSGTTAENETVAASAETEGTVEKTTEEPAGEEKEPEEGETDLAGHSLMIYCGAGMTDPFEEIAKAFGEETGCEMNVTYANAGQIQAQIKTSEEGDFFIAGSADELKPVSDYVVSQKDLVKHIPVLAVQEGNPKNITGLSSLTAEGVSLIMGEAESTPIGKIAQKALADAGISDQVNVAATTTTAPQMATVIAAGEADAAIVWKENCNADGVEIVDTEDLDAYVKTVPAAVLGCSDDKAALSAFNDYLDSEKAQVIWESYGYEIVE